MGYISEVLRTVTGAEKALGVRWLCSVWWPWNNTEERAAPSAVGVRSKERSTRRPLSGRSWTSGADALMHTRTHTRAHTTPRTNPAHTSEARGAGAGMQGAPPRGPARGPASARGLPRGPGDRALGRPKPGPPVGLGLQLGAEGTTDLGKLNGRERPPVAEPHPPVCPPRRGAPGPSDGVCIRGDPGKQLPGF